ncbi:translocation/assembly module TamB domain-containing protein [Glaciecola sp. SC05]|uniref:translocation/assembly module TamB domain-containing protein n=1 Tax=Glaciecola sp. SC05 TaxID=1987355 RepID=UPI0035279DC8
MSMRKFTQYLALAFLTLCLLSVLLVLAAGSNYGLRAAAYFANQVDGVSIEGIKGSLYSKVFINSIQLNIDEGVNINAGDAEIDIKLSCALDLAACLSHLRVNKLDVTLPVAKVDQLEQSATQYITLPIPVDIKNISINQFTLSQTLADGSDKKAHKLLAIVKLNVKEISVFERVNIGQLLVDDIRLFAKQTAQVTAPAQALAEGPAFSLEMLQDMLKTAPSIALPEVFIPVNMRLRQAAVNRLCWQVDVQPDPKNCMALKSAAVDIQNQSVDARLQLEAEALLGSNGILAKQLHLQAKLNIANNWAHNVRASLVQQQNTNKQAELVFTALGNASSTDFEAMVVRENVRSPLLKASLQGDWAASEFPIVFAGNIEELSPLKLFLEADFNIDLSRASFSIDGDWQSYRISVQTELISSVSAETGLSSLSLLAIISPAKQSMAIEKFVTDGQLGKVSLSGNTGLETLKASPNPLAIMSDLKLSLNALNLGIFNPDLASNINGQLSLTHEFTEKWMRGELICKNLKGSFAGFPLSAKCDVSISKNGVIHIKQLAFDQADSKLNASGKFTLPHTQYLRLNTEDMLATMGQLSFSADVPDASQFDKDLAGAIELEGSMSGSLSAPKIALVSSVTALLYDNIGLEQANIDLTIDANNNYSVALEINIAELAIDTFVVNSSNIRASGNQDEHRVSLNVQTKDFSASNTFTGGLRLNEQVTRWRGRWLAGEIRLPFSTLTIDNAAAIVANVTAKSYSLGDHCWIAENAKDSICFSDLNFADDIGTGLLDIAYDIASIPRHYTPEMVLPDTSLPLKGNVTVHYSKAKGLNLKAYNNIIGGVLETTRHTLDLTAIIANFTVENETLSTVVHAGSERTGIVGLRSQLDLRPEQRNHVGRLVIDNFDLNLFQRFIPSTQSILGMVNADIGFDGPLIEPVLNGQLTVSSGELILDAYTYPLSDFNHTMIFAGQMASMQGSFQLGKGTGTYNADVTFAAPFSISGSLSGKDMQFAFSNSKAQISPDLTFKISPSDLMLKGVVAIPSAQIKVEELPENARMPSSDTIIIGQKTPEPVVPLAMDIDLNIQIDKAKRGFVTVDALDLEATLSGDLSFNLEQKRSTTDDSFQPMRTTLNGQVNVLDGSYEAYGQMLVIRAGKIFFNGEPSLPQFDIRAIRNPLNTEGDVIAGLHVTGNPVVPRVELFSEPPMTQAKQLSYLLQGRDLSTRGANAGSSTETALINALVSFGVGRSENRLGQLGDALGFDSLNMQTAGAGDNSQVQITGRIAEDIQITYGIGVLDQASEVILKYQIMPQLFIEAKSGASSAVDLFYQISRGQAD